MTKSIGKNKPKHIWTDAEREQLVKLYPDMRAADVAEIMGLRVSQIHQMAVKLKVGKSAAFKVSDSSGRILRGKKNPGMMSTQFKPGVVPWNKGVSYQPGGRIKESQFKPGNRIGKSQEVYKPIGTLRINGDGYLDRKITDEGPMHKRWERVHRLVWQEANGPIPDGHIIVFKPGCRTIVEAEITADRLECITLADHARRNSVWGKNPELAKLYQLKGAITRQVRRIKEESHA